MVSWRFVWLVVNLVTCLLLMVESREITRLKLVARTWEDLYTQAVCRGQAVCIHDNRILGNGPVGVAMLDASDVVIMNNVILDPASIHRDRDGNIVLGHRP